MITALRLKNFRILREASFSLKPLTVIVGPNGSGKSTVLHALSLLMDVLGNAFRTARFPEAANFRSRSATGQIGIEALLEVGEQSYDVELSFQGEIFSHKGIDPFLDIQPARWLKLDVRELAAPSYPEDVGLDLPGDGKGLSSILAGLYLEDLQRFRNLVAKLREVTPEVQDITLKRVQRDRVGFEIQFDMKGGKAIPASFISDGTLLILGLLTALETSGTAQLVLIDDLEHALHPKALREMVQLLRRYLSQNPELQIIATSHSPYLLDFLKAEEILLTSLDEDGYAAVKPLNAHPEYERWKDVMAPGEFWSTVGESWITAKGASKTR